MFPVTSRYFNVTKTTLKTPEGREIIYLRRRFVSAARSLTVTEHAVSQGERLDNISDRYLGDPEQFWQLCDANDAMHPDELTAEIGHRLRIPQLVVPGGS